MHRWYVRCIGGMCDASLVCAMHRCYVPRIAAMCHADHTPHVVSADHNAHVVSADDKPWYLLTQDASRAMHTCYVPRILCHRSFGILCRHLASCVRERVCVDAMHLAFCVWDAFGILCHEIARVVLNYVTRVYVPYLQVCDAYMVCLYMVCALQCAVECCIWSVFIWYVRCSVL